MNVNSEMGENVFYQRSHLVKCGIVEVAEISKQKELKGKLKQILIFMLMNDEKYISGTK